MKKLAQLLLAILAAMFYSPAQAGINNGVTGAIYPLMETVPTTAASVIIELSATVAEG